MSTIFKHPGALFVGAMVVFGIYALDDYFSDDGPADGWLRWTAPDKTFVIETPVEPRVDHRTLDSPAVGLIELDLYTLPTDDFVVSVTRLPPPQDGTAPPGAKERLRGAIASALARSEANLVRQRNLTAGTIMGAELELEEPATKVETLMRVFISGSTLVQVSASFTGPPERARRFVRSMLVK